MAEFPVKYETVELNSGQRFRNAIRIQAKYETHRAELRLTVS